jgi:hypothetical protein
VERDHGESAAGTEHRLGGRQRALDGPELVVHLDAERLEHALGGMALAEARRRRDRGADQLDQLGGALDRRLAARADDRAGDRPRVALLAVAAEDVGQLALAGLVDDLARRDGGAGVHAHVERRVGRIREPALAPVELHRRHA